MRENKNKLRNIYCCLKLGVCLGLSAVAVGSVIDTPYTVYAEDYTDKFYEGYASGRVNVRVGAGQDNDQVVHNGEKVQLKAGDKVVIIGEEMVGDKVWYKVRFTRDETEIVGFCTSSYVEKTESVITLTPTPSPSPTPTPSPTPSPSPSPTPEATPTTEAASPTPAPTEEKGGNGGIIAAVIIVVLAAAALIFLRWKKTQAANSTANRKMAQLKKMKLEDSGDGTSADSRGKRKPEVKQKANYRDTQAEQVFQDVYLKNPEAQEEFAYVDQGNADEIRANAARENEERKALREEIENLREHDLVIHKYFGKGEVYDNSDVRLIEVRFGGDVRFMNKDALAAKKLMKKCSEDTMRYHRRSSDRQTDYQDF